MLMINNTFSLSHPTLPSQSSLNNKPRQNEVTFPYETKLVGFTYLKRNIQNKYKGKGEKEGVQKHLFDKINNHITQKITRSQIWAHHMTKSE